jgi:hypothetical protein
VYLRDAASVEGFRGLLGFPDLSQVYTSDRLFPLFSQRIMNSERPDYGRFLESPDLESTSQPWEVLARSEGRREGDSILVFPEPNVKSDGTSHAEVLVHGIRHRQQSDPRVDQCLNALTTGDVLVLVNEPDNPTNPHAVLVADSGHVPLGYIPDLLLGYIADLRINGEPHISVARVNPPDTPPHLRLLINIEG